MSRMSALAIEDHNRRLEEAWVAAGRPCGDCGDGMVLEAGTDIWECLRCEAALDQFIDAQIDEAIEARHDTDSTGVDHE